MNTNSFSCRFKYIRIFQLLLLVLGFIVLSSCNGGDSKVDEVITVVPSNDEGSSVTTQDEPSSEEKNETETNSSATPIVPLEETEVSPDNEAVDITDETDESAMPVPVPENTFTDIDSVAQEVIENVGTILEVHEGEPNKIVFVFEETHGSPAGQVEIATMLNRLYERYGLRIIGLEGSFKADGPLDASWFEPSLTIGATIGSREDVIVQMLEDGEINSSEALTMIYPDLVVEGIENADEYNYEPPDEAWSSDTFYLFLIAAQSLTEQDVINEFNQLVDEDKILEALELVINSDEWTSEIYGHLRDEEIIISCEEYIEILDDIAEKADEVNAEISNDDRKNLEDLKEFYVRCSERSETMVANVVDFTSESDNPVAMIIGAAHTEHVAHLLEEAGFTYAVIRGNALEEGKEEGDLHYQAYDRKSSALSIYPSGTLGSLLDGRKKPPPVINQVWYQNEANALYITDVFARALASGDEPPFTDILDNLPSLEGITIDEGSIRVSAGDIIFHMIAMDKNNNPIDIWVRARANPGLAKTLEERLLEANNNFQDKETPDNEVDEIKADEPTLVRVSSETVAKFATSEAEIATATLDN